MQTLRICYDELPKNKALLLKEAFKEHFKCSTNTFYRVLDNPNVTVKHLSFFYKNAAFVYDVENELFKIDYQKLTNDFKSKYGLTLKSA